MWKRDQGSDVPRVSEESWAWCPAFSTLPTWLKPWDTRLPRELRGAEGKARIQLGLAWTCQQLSPLKALFCLTKGFCTWVGAATSPPLPSLPHPALHAPGAQ